MPGEVVTVYVRFVGSSSKRLHYLMFLVDDTRGKLAATLECVNAFADLESRKTAPFPAEATAKIAAGLAVHAALDWVAPVSGAMQA
jgi:acyl-CoA thioester hydrolase